LIVVIGFLIIAAYWGIAFARLRAELHRLQRSRQ
jgi:hypothetical protein